MVKKIPQGRGGGGVGGVGEGCFFMSGVKGRFHKSEKNCLNRFCPRLQVLS